ncbi:hypothetical protein HPC38_01685 [Pasteurellaceae bacterium HPA106]|uniref:hypothetical protein n=1 Tax=Spirabiliibacterium pneumoniae TaxID=221400 RepID=UPI001AADF00B|nr:hypothetical protein [Spirabiliibacterium pneumoniae]MBE2895587.1 hypothetical protein [Spirabiliibacterium pneumoniae]
MLDLLYKCWLLIKGIGYGIATVLLVLAVVMTDDAVLRYILVVGFSLILCRILWG